VTQKHNSTGQSFAKEHTRKAHSVGRFTPQNEREPSVSWNKSHIPRLAHY